MKNYLTLFIFIFLYSTLYSQTFSNIEFKESIYNRNLDIYEDYRSYGFESGDISRLIRELNDGKSSPLFTNEEQVLRGYLILSPTENIDYSNIYCIKLRYQEPHFSSDITYITTSNKLAYYKYDIQTNTPFLDNKVQIPNGEYFQYILVYKKVKNSYSSFDKEPIFLKEASRKKIIVEGGDVPIEVIKEPITEQTDSQFKILLSTPNKGTENTAVDGIIMPIVTAGHSTKGNFTFDVKLTNSGSTTGSYIRLYISDDYNLDNKDYFLDVIHTTIPEGTNTYTYTSFITSDIPFSGKVILMMQIDTKNEDLPKDDQLIIRKGSNVVILGEIYIKQANLKSSFSSLSENNLFLSSKEENIDSEIKCQLISEKSTISITNIPSEYIGGNVIISGIHGLNARQIKITDTNLYIPNTWKFTDKYIVIKLTSKENSILSFKFAN